MTQSTKKPNKIIAPWLPVKYEVADVAAIQALQRGDASEHQQKRALSFIVNVIAATYDQPYFPDSARDTDFACGRMFTGQQIVKMTKLNLSKLKAMENSKEENPL